MTQRLIEVFTADCPLCHPTVQLVQELACPACEIQIWHLGADDATQGREQAAQYGIHRVPAVVVDGKLADCCQNQQPISRESLIQAGVGQG
ncbi:hypothetical protein C1752_08463 [Acaryochloris thomasi RCC1774]|uniref:Thioredoxin-like fold domain-containing protein n=1 Tax=Acaryochloris thomasi RCC1774 TaxID=1764569 RepID=A0A2W1JP52_9CYAN|nr:thioredoxin family protein [Acaryochloris thomasi]PZD71021.1 hypothetical protein C1752_08463 [Acaryochloris thomasi RCC1774]